MSLRDIMLREEKARHKCPCCMILFTWRPERGKADQCERDQKSGYGRGKGKAGGLGGAGGRFLDAGNVSCLYL